MRLLPLLLLLTACPPLKHARPDGDGDGLNVDVDCDDADPAIGPGQREVCDGADNDCDGLADDDALDALSRYADGDGDGYGGGAAVPVCPDEPGYVDVAGDCDDASAAVLPTATETCNGKDDDCDGDTDEPDAADAVTAWADADGDGHGDPDQPTTACTHGAGTTTSSDDCNDGDASVYPGAADGCDGVDADCDGTIDEDASVFTWYPDGDGDGYGDDFPSVTGCETLEGWVTVGGDCDDEDDRVLPGAVETCNEEDDDCDGVVDDGAVGGFPGWPDADGDGYGDASAASVTLCAVGDGYVDNDADCDDSSASAAPGGIEVCDGLDNDCDGRSDVDASDAIPWFLDGDGDGYGDASTARLACTGSADEVEGSGDCDDTDAAVSPAGTEVCDGAGADEDCDALVDDEDDSLAGASLWYADGDGDGYGAGAPRAACVAGAGEVDNADDCDDTDAAILPGGTELCDGGTDEDCDGLVDSDDPSAAGEASWYADLDDDGWGIGAVIAVSCSSPGSAATRPGDCDDAVAAVNPGAAEVCDSLDLDEDCSGAADDADPAVTDPVAWYTDADRDGFGTGVLFVSCDAPVTSASVAGDCDDQVAGTYPGALERCNDADDDCDNATFEDGLVTLDDASNHASIQEALDAASAGSTVAVCAGIWSEALRIDTPVTLVGYAGPVIEGGPSGTSTLEVSADPVTVRDLTLSGGQGRDLTGDGATEGGNLLVSSGSVLLDGVTVDGGAAAYGGGAWVQAGASLDIVDGSFTDNEASAWGGALMTGDSVSVTVSGSVFTGNTGSYGGAIGTGTGAQLTMDTTVLSGNVAREGGAIYLAYGATGDLSDTVLEDHTAVTGGALYVYDGATLVGTRLEIDLNDASGDGGGIYARGASVALNASSVADNTAEDGGGVYTEAGVVVLLDTELSRNTATGYGGGHYLGSSSAEPALASLGGTTWSTNIATSGGGLYLGTSAYVEGSGDAWDGNQASDGGGIELADNATLILNSATISGNVAYTGAGLYVNPYAYVELSYGALQGNVATSYGGGALVQRSSTIQAYEVDMGGGSLADNSPDDVYTVTYGDSYTWLGVVTVYCTSSC